VVDGCLSRFLYAPSSDAPAPRRCVDSIAVCPAAHSDAELASSCTRPAHVSYVYGLYAQPYRNRDCAACHGVADYSLTCNRSSVIDQRGPPIDNFASFAIVFDLNTGKGATLGADTAAQQRLSSCPQVTITLLYIWRELP